MLRRLHSEQPDTFAFTDANLAWAEAQITKYPEGREASGIIPLLWRAQEQEGWLSRPAIEYVADMLGLAYIRALEVASFYFMFQLQPVGTVAHFQICGTTSCMICGAEDLIGVCKEKIAKRPHQISEDGKFSWEEVECLGSCSNAPMAQIGKDYYEDLTAERFAEIIDELAEGGVPTPGPQNGRYASEPLSGLTSLKEYEAQKLAQNASVQLATDIGETVKRIDGTEVPLVAPWGDQGGRAKPMVAKPANAPDAPKTKETKDTAGVVKPSTALAGEIELAARKGTWTYGAEQAEPARNPEMLEKPRDGQPDDLKLLKGVGPKLEQSLNDLGVYHFDQIANWSEADIEWVDARVKLKARIEKDGWIEQSKVLSEKDS